MVDINFFPVLLDSLVKTEKLSYIIYDNLNHKIGLNHI